MSTIMFAIVMVKALPLVSPPENREGFGPCLATGAKRETGRVATGRWP